MRRIGKNFTDVVGITSRMRWTNHDLYYIISQDNWERMALVRRRHG